MKDLNFFISSHAKKEHAPVNRFLLILIVVIVLAVGAPYFFLNDQNNRLRQDVAALQSELARPDVAAQLEEVNRVNTQLQLLKRYSQGLDTIDAALQPGERLKKATLDTIAAAIPPSVTLKSLTLSANDLQLEAASTDLTANAELVHNLKATGLFASVDLQSAAASDAEDAPRNDRTIMVHAILQEVMPE
jgi:Tfp pilus assembly protein PilN